MQKKILASTLALLLTVGSVSVGFENFSFVNVPNINAAAEDDDDNYDKVDEDDGNIDWDEEDEDKDDTLVDGNFKYRKNGDGTVTIVEYIAAFPVAEIPSDIDGQKVTVIGKGAFFDCDVVTSVIIPDTVKTIQNNAFSKCESLIDVNIPKSVTTIEEHNFTDCEILSGLNVDEDNTVYSTDRGVLYSKDKTKLVFHPDGIKDMTIPDTVTEIGNYAFENCKGLSEMKIPDTVKTIGNGSFFGCENLNKMIIPESITSIGDYAFCNCKDLGKVDIPDSVTHIGDKSLGYVMNGNKYEQKSDFQINCNSNSAGAKYAQNSKISHYLEDKKQLVTVVSHTHKYKKTVVKPTYLAGGYTLNKCSCGKSFKNKFTKKLVMKAPVRVIAVGQKKKAVIKWSAVKGARGYKVFIKTSKKGKYRPVKALKGRRLVKTRLKSRKTYYFAVKSYKKIGKKYVFSPAKYKTVKVK